MAAKNSSPELSFGDWEDEDVDELLSSECQEGGRFANLQDTDLNKIVTESYSKSTKANTKWAAKPKAFQGKYSDIEIYFREQIKTALDLIAVVRFLSLILRRPKSTVIDLGHLRIGLQVSWRSVCSFR